MKTGADGRFSADVVADAGSMRGPPGTDDAIALVWTYPLAISSAYDFDYRYVLASARSDMRIVLHRRTEISAGDSVGITISPDDAVCTNNVQDMHPWPTEWGCRTVYILPPADGTVSIYAVACPADCLPLGPRG